MKQSETPQTWQTISIGFNDLKGEKRNLVETLINDFASSLARNLDLDGVSIETDSGTI